ncbi:RHS repeat-associated core domain-containing protein [Fibrobacter sp. UWB12]|uniref:RHS repeat-associated core domain-containing protein n=1 Tax=Fibrobacter sp. UWB12 TaxID=1896203 RepID=UPI0009134C04|nr:RHS repeat-associated core domain-containing protein [Fibrobacter sp. UWB12]SHK61109.1 RHS repeat-associated core domain-containing protein [Fibrobacter sp. UWB12]
MDAQKNRFEAKSFNINIIDKNHLEANFSFDAGQINSQNVQFPISIAPSIVSDDISAFSYQHYTRIDENSPWQADIQSSSPIFFENNALEKNTLTINQEVISGLQEKKLAGFFIKPNPNTIFDNTIHELQFGHTTQVFPGHGHSLGFIDVTEDIISSHGNKVEIDIFPHAESEGKQREAIEHFQNSRGSEIIPGSIRIPHEGIELHPQTQDEPNDIDADIIIKYFIDDETMPANESYALAGGLNANVTLDTGEMTATFDDIALIKTSLPFKISHTYKQSDNFFGCGKNWRLNLQQTLIKGSTTNNGSDFIYTDGNGYQHGFIETYYYFDAAGKKVPIEKKEVQVDSLGRMFCELSEGKKEVFKDQRTSSGLELKSRLEGFKGIEYNEQRQSDEKQLEELIFSLDKALREYVIVSKIGEIKKELKDYFENDTITSEKVDNFVNSLERGQKILQKQEAIQLRSLFLQKNAYVKQREDNEKQRSLLRTDSLEANLHSLEFQEKSLAAQKDSIKTSLRSLWESVKRDEFQLKLTYKKSTNDNSYTEADKYEEINLLEDELREGSAKYKQYKDIYKQAKLLGMSDHELENTLYLNYTLLSTTPSIVIEQESSPRLLHQGNLLTEQKRVTNRQIQDVEIQKSLLLNDEYIQEQIVFINKQIDYIKGQSATRIIELRNTYKDYYNYRQNLINLKQSMAIAYLSDGNSSLCFNQYGNLCALTDSFGNLVSVKYDINNRISSLSDDKNSINFKYTPYGLLSSITDYNGNRVEYIYSSASCDALLQSVKLSNGDTIDFTYERNYLTKISSALEKNATQLKYKSPIQNRSTKPLDSIVNYTLVTKITDTLVTCSDSGISESNTLSKTTFKYGTHECTIDNDGKEKRYFMADLGCFIGGYGKKDDGSIGVCSYTYVDRENNESFSIHEIDDAVFDSTLIPSTPLAGIPIMFQDAEADNNNEYDHVITADKLPENSKEYMLSAIISKTSSNNSLRLIGNINHNFTQLKSTQSISKTDKFMGLKAKVTYKDRSKEIFQMPALCRDIEKQLCALPISIKLNGAVEKIEFAVYNSTNLSVSCDMMRLTPAECEYKKFDEFKNLILSESGNDFVSSATGTDNRYFRKTSTEYKYSESHLLLEKNTTYTDRLAYTENLSFKDFTVKEFIQELEEETKLYPADFQLLLSDATSSKPLWTHSGSPTTDFDNTKKFIEFMSRNGRTTNSITKYAYNDKGAQIREETYIKGEEATRGIMVSEKVFDDKGNVIKEKVYNTLDSSSKTYHEKIFNEDGSIQCEFDDFGLNKTIYDIDPQTNQIATKTYPSGSKFAYSRDCHTNKITSISLSTEDGDSNSIQTHYNCGLITKHTCSTNSIEYEYNAKREKTAVYFNGVKKAEYQYEKNIKQDNKLLNKTTATLLGLSNEQITTEAYVDSKNNLIQSTLNGDTIFTNSYSKTNILLSSEDFVTGTGISTNYDEENHRLNSISRSAGSEKFDYMPSYKEDFKYNADGKLKEHDIMVGDASSPLVNQKYTFKYNTNKAKTLNSTSLPNGLTYKPQKDVLGRNTGKTLLNANGDKILGEYISYRKIGDHTSNMVSSISYGEKRNGQFSISEGIRYKYDSNGNIIEKWENGKFAVAYAYDYLNRLIREDNAYFQKTWLYSYDGNGNRTIRTEFPITRQKTSEIIDYTKATVNSYSYDGDLLISDNENTFSYDGFGNPVTFKNKNLSWENGKLMQFENIEFDYDGYGKRTKKGSTYFTYDTDKNLILMQKDGESLEFIYDDDGISGIKYQGNQYILRKNAQGDVTHIYSIEGTLEARYEYDAWGNHMVLDASGNEITFANHIANMNPFRYRSYIYDNETNLYYLINRYYDPEIGRFISQDQIGYLQPEVINGLNLFAYCCNNPVMRTDEEGCWSLWRSIKRAAKKIYKTAKKTVTFVAGVACTAVGAAMYVAGKAASAYVTFEKYTHLASFDIMGYSAASLLGSLSKKISSLGSNICSRGVNLLGSSISVNLNFNLEKFGDKAMNAIFDIVVNSNPILSTAYKAVNMGLGYLEKGEAFINNIKQDWGRHIQQAVLSPINGFISFGMPPAVKWCFTEFYNEAIDIASDWIDDEYSNSMNNREEYGKQALTYFLLGGYSLI